MTMTAANDDHANDDLKPGDRVSFTLLGQVRLYGGIIVAETPSGHGWMITRDGCKAAKPVHRRFCQREQPCEQSRD